MTRTALQSDLAETEFVDTPRLVLYSDAGHGFLFQHADDFGHEILEFLR